MNQKITNLWNKNFITFLIITELSLISDGLLRFALPLYILISTGNPAVMGIVLAINHIPYIILGPIGGVGADRISKRKILVLMNLASGLVIIPYLIITQLFYVIPFTVTLLFVISVFGSLSSPSLEGSLPVLVPEDDLSKANSVYFALTIISSVGVPILSGFIMERFGVTPIIVTSSVLYLLAAFVSLILKIPFSKQSMEYGLVKTVGTDLKDAFTYLINENPYLAKVIGLNTIVGIILAPTLTVGIPVLVITYMDRSESILGLVSGVVIFGGTVGIIAMQFLGEKATVKLIPWLILIASFVLGSTGLVFILVDSGILLFVYLVISLFIIFALTSVLEVLTFTYVGQITSEFMVGKIMAIMVSFMVLGFAIGDYLYGLLLRRFVYHGNPGFALLIFAFVGLGVAVLCNVKSST